MVDISIIIPHKNSSKLLERLLKSIPSSINAQVLVIDDNSRVEECKSLETLSKTYSFELYKNNDGLGAGAARNVGLEYAKGDWLMFADADDFYLDSLNDKFNQYKESDYDIIFFDVNSCYSDTLEPAYRDEHIKSIASKYLRTKDEGYLRYNYLAPWGKLIRQSLLADNYIDFENIIAGNDMMFSVKSGLAAKTICYDSTPIYMLTLSAGSITTTLTKDRFDSRLKATLRINKLLRGNNQSEFQASVLYFLAKAHQFGLRYMLNVIFMCVKHRANIFIGFNKIGGYKKIIQNRQNTTVK
ncbi:MAG: glycosyltransferase family A protein [bacterium]